MVQQVLFKSRLELVSQHNLPEAFRRLYFHLYTNSKASRAESIIEDLSLLLLIKLASERNGGDKLLKRYIQGQGDANRLLLPFLRETYPGLVDESQRFSMGDDAIRIVLNDLLDTSLLTAPAHALGEAFQALIGPRMRGEKGQFFTPRSLVKAMVEIIAPQSNESILDPACGTGGFLAEAHIYQNKCSAGKLIKGTLIGIDKDRGLSRLAAALLQIVTTGRVRIWNFNSLDNTQWEKEIGKLPEKKFDVVLTNPPFGSRIGVTEKRILAGLDFGHQWIHQKHTEHWHKSNLVVKMQDPQILFLEFCVRALKPNGRLGIVLPEGLFGNKKTAYVWDWLERQGRLTALIDCPRTTFQPGTDTKTNVLFFTRNSEPVLALNRPNNDKTKIAVSLHCGHDRRGKNIKSDGDSYPDDFPVLACEYHIGNAIKSAWKEVDLQGKRYIVPRYYYEQGSVTNREAELTSTAEVVSLKTLVRRGLITLRKGHEVGSDAYGTGDIPFVRTSDLSNFEIAADPTKSISLEVYKKFAVQQNLIPGDILIVVDGRYRIGTTALLTENNFKCVVQSHFRIIGTPNRNELDPYELMFALNLPSVRLRMRNLVFIQSTLGTLGNRLLELKIPLLHGNGPWSILVEQFRDKLCKRDHLLGDLKNMSGPEFDL